VQTFASTKPLKSLSVVVPVFNEELHIRNTLRNIVDAKLKAKNISFVEVIVVNDASKDLTLSIVKEFVSQCSERESFKILDCQTNCGVGHAFWTGTSVATGQFITLVPGDGVYSNKALTDLFCEFSQNGVTLTARINKHRQNKFRRQVSNLIGVWFSWIVDTRVQDPHSLFVFPTATVNDAYKEIWPSLKYNKDLRIGFEYNLRILQWILQTNPISRTLEVEVNTKLEKNSSYISIKVLSNYLKHYGWMTLRRINRGSYPRISNTLFKRL